MVSEVSMATAMSWSRWRVASASHSLLVYLAPECLTWLGECEISEEFVRREPSENLPERLSPNVAKSSQVMLIKAPHLLFVSLSLSGTWSVRTLWLMSRRSRRSTAAAWKRDASPAQTPERTPSSDSMLTFTASLLFESSPLQPSRGGLGVWLHLCRSDVKEDNLCCDVSCSVQLYYTSAYDIWHVIRGVFILSPQPVCVRKVYSCLWTLSQMSSRGQARPRVNLAPGPVDRTDSNLIHQIKEGGSQDDPSGIHWICI